MSDIVKFAVIGNPISHSLSPQIHQHFAAQFNITLSYEAIEAPLDDFAGTIKNLQKDNYLGANITVPFKSQAFELANSKDTYSQLASAANTLTFNADSSIDAFNTDGRGLVKDLSDIQNISLKNKTVLILGAGGAVQGIIKPLLDAGVSSISISNRTHRKAQTIARKFSSYAQVYAIQQALIPYTPSFDIVINGTSAGLTGETLDIPANLVTRQSICYDLMYSHTDTAFVQWAKTQKVAHVCDGLGMLIEQAALSFFIWHGHKPNTISTKKQLLTFLNK